MMVEHDRIYINHMMNELKKALGADFGTATNHSTKDPYKVIDDLIITLYLHHLLSVQDVVRIVKGEIEYDDEIQSETS